MSPKDHFIFGSAATVALYPAMGADALWFWGASFAIDIDHYIDYVYHNGFRDFSIKNMFAFHKALEGFWRRPEFLNIEVFHTVEFLAPLSITAYWLGSMALIALCWGLLFHVFLDTVFLLRNRIFSIRANSFTEYFIRKRLFERHGLRPRAVFEEAIDIVNGRKA